MSKSIVQLIGAAAFIIGGILARENTIDGIELLEKKFRKEKPPEPIET